MNFYFPVYILLETSDYFYQKKLVLKYNLCFLILHENKAG